MDKTTKKADSKKTTANKKKVSNKPSTKAAKKNLEEDIAKKISETAVMRNGNNEALTEDGVYTIPVKREIYLYVFPLEAKQGEADIKELISRFGLVRRERFGRRRPSLKEGWWKLSTGDWARRENAHFVKAGDGNWFEIPQTPGLNDRDRMGTRPAAKAREKNITEEVKEDLT